MKKEVINKILLSPEFIRKHLKTLDKLELRKNDLGLLHAIQDVRQIGRLKSSYPGERAEFDFTKNGIYLFPNSNFNEPVLYTDGMGVDHASGAIGSLVTSTTSTSRDALRLFKNYVTPKSIWLPPDLWHFAQRWDVFGIPRFIAIDNGAEFTANSILIAFIFGGSIIILMPPRRGDLKGTVERTQWTMETTYLSQIGGYISPKHAGLNPKYSKVRQKAMIDAKLTYSEYLEKRVSFACEYNHGLHPRLQKRRIDVFRDGQEQAPLMLLTGKNQRKIAFSMAYRAKLTREGVQVENLKFNSSELHDAYRIYTGDVLVKMDPDDIRSVWVLIPQHSEPIEARLTTFEYPYPVTLEVHQAMRSLNKTQADFANTSEEDYPYSFGENLSVLQNATQTSKQGTVVHKQIQAVSHASIMPTMQANDSPELDLAAMLAGTKLPDVE